MPLSQTDDSTIGDYDKSKLEKFFPKKKKNKFKKKYTKNKNTKQ